MDDQKKYTEEDMQRARREGFRAAVSLAKSRGLDWTWGGMFEGWEPYMRRKYPIKKRVERTTSCEKRTFRLNGAGLVVMDDHGHDSDLFCPKCVEAMADLLARPYEEVEE